MDNRELGKEIELAHTKHAWTLAFMVFAAFCGLAYWLDAWLNTKRGGWADIASTALYIVSFFAVLGMGPVKDWFLHRLYKPKNTD